MSRHTLSQPPALEITQLLYRWPGQALPCLDIPSFTLAAGERLFLHGPSGSGKSTLLGLIGGIHTPERGDLAIIGHSLRALGARGRDQLRADHIGFIFQQFNLLPWLSAIDNVLLPCHFSRERRQKANAQHTLNDEAARLLHQLDLAPELWKRPAAELSVGQQQRVAAARALIGHPALIVADEPTSALDASRQQAFIDLLLREASAAGAALVFVSHDHRLAHRFDRELALESINRAQADAAEINA